MEDFNSIIFTDMSLGAFLAYALLVGMALFFVNYVNTSNRNVNSVKSPVKFSWSYWITYNWKRVLFSIIALYFGIVHYPILNNGNPITAAGAIMMGLSWESFIVGVTQIAKKKSNG